jgi:hypothetical protein
LFAEPNYYGEEIPMFVNLFPIWNKSEKQNVEYGNLWVIDLQENYGFKIYYDVS